MQYFHSSFINVNDNISNSIKPNCIYQILYKTLGNNLLQPSFLMFPFKLEAEERISRGLHWEVLSMDYTNASTPLIIMIIVSMVVIIIIVNLPSAISINNLDFNTRLLQTKYFTNHGIKSNFQHGLRKFSNSGLGANFHQSLRSSEKLDAQRYNREFGCPAL